MQLILTLDCSCGVFVWIVLACGPVWFCTVHPGERGASPLYRVQADESADPRYPAGGAVEHGWTPTLLACGWGTCPFGEIYADTHKN